MKIARTLAALLIVVSIPSLAGVGADAARERRWADEIVTQLVVGDAVWLATPRHDAVLALFTEPVEKTDRAIVVVHGMGVHPDWSLIGLLRMELAQLGFATLSVQMPVLGAQAQRADYTAVFPDAGERLDAAIDWLRARDYARIAVVSHSMGSAMVNAWISRQKSPEINAWVPVGLLVDFATPPRLPVLDVIAERDFPEAIAAAKKRVQRLRKDGCSSSLVVPGADHYFGTATPRLAAAIKPFLDRALGGC